MGLDFDCGIGLEADSKQVMVGIHSSDRFVHLIVCRKFGIQNQNK